ncbi:MAG: CAP domain-containing protein [Bacteroidota bacterium]
MERALLFFTLLLLPLSGMTQTYRSKDIDSLLRVADWDTIQKIELLASYEFHQLLNDYRTSNNRSALKWSKHLWLASRNHCQWMKSNVVVGHDQMKSTTNFTGAKPGDRILYIGKGKAIGAWSGENALYNYLNKTNSDSINIKSIAKQMAEESFGSWRSSSGHNKNMLSDHVSEGTAFIIDHNGKYWGVSVFARSNCEGEWIWSQNGASNLVNLKNELSPFDLKLLEDDIMEELQRASNQKMDLPLSKAAAHHSNYLMRSNTLTHEQSKIKRYYFGKTPEKRLLKTTKGIFWIKKQGT